MDIHDIDSAPKFESRDDCRKWIADRVVRFKLRMVPAREPDGTPGGRLTFIPRKCDGKIVIKTAEDFKPSGTDEPLSNYAYPMKHERKWIAIMKLSS